MGSEEVYIVLRERRMCKGRWVGERCWMRRRKRVGWNCLVGGVVEGKNGSREEWLFVLGWTS